MGNVAFIVDGDTEKRFIQSICKGGAIRKVGNGDRYPTKVIAQKINAEINLLGNRYEHIAVMMDLEKRTMTPKEFALDISNHLQNQGLINQNVHIFIKEREIEDWILADPISLSEYVGEPVTTANLKGKYGLTEILLKYGIKYNEATIGVSLLKNVVCSRAINQCATLRHTRAHFPVQCWWLER